MRTKRLLLLLLAAGLCIALPPTCTAWADNQGTPLERANGEMLANAIGHYARARSLLIAAVREFDKGYQLVDPAAIMDVPSFRATLLDRVDELGRVLDPQPRASKGGIKFEGDPRLLGEAKP